MVIILWRGYQPKLWTASPAADDDKGDGQGNEGGDADGQDMFHKAQPKEVDAYQNHNANKNAVEEVGMKGEESIGFFGRRGLLGHCTIPLPRQR